jgi:hypothetical protein
MLEPASALHRFAERALGPCQVAASPVGSPGSGLVVRIRDCRGREYVAKRHASASKHAQEVHAYQQWAPALGAGAARLVAADAQTMTILLTALPGHPPDGHGDAREDHYRQAGALLRLLHNAEPARPLPGFRHWLDDRASWWQRQSAPLLSAGDQRVINDHLAALQALGIPDGGPGHFDFQPRNWVVDGAGTLRVIDFEHARIGLQARDFTRLHFRYWATRPGLRDAFLDGYQRQLTAAEQQAMIHCGALDVLTALARGAQTGDPALVCHARATLARLRTGG